MSTRAGRTARPPAEHPRHPARRPALGHARLCRTSARQDAADRPHRQRRREFQERLLHDVAMLAQPRVAIERRLRAQARRHEQLHRVPGGDEQLSEGAPAGGLRHGVRRQVPHGRGERRAAPGIRVFRDPQGPGQVLRHRVQPQRRAARGEERLLHHRRHRHRARLVAARSPGPAMDDDPRPQGAAQLLYAGGQVQTRL